MNKETLISKVSAETGETKDRVNKVINGTLKVIKDELVDGESVSLAGFGSFLPTIVPAHKQKSALQGGKVIDVPDKGRIAFRASNNLKDAIADAGSAPVKSTK